MKFADLTEGRRIALGPIVVDGKELVDFARKYDDQWFHTDAAQAQGGPFEDGHGVDQPELFVAAAPPVAYSSLTYSSKRAFSAAFM